MSQGPQPKTGAAGVAKAQFADGAADIARRFGLSIKALRLYEELGLLRPARDHNGWRSYGRADCERLHRIVALRELGLPLAAIADLFARDHEGLGSILALQEHALLEQRAKAEEALAIVRSARARVAAGELLDAEALAELVRRTKAARFRWTPELSRIAAETFSDEQRRRLAEVSVPDLNAQWAEFYAELAVLTELGDPTTPAALALGRRGEALLRRLDGADTEMQRAMAEFWRQGLANPATAADLPMTPAQWTFFGRVRGLLHHQDPPS